MEMYRVVEPSASAPEPTLAELLQSVPEFTEGADLVTYITALVADASSLDKNGRDALVNANIRRVRIGQAWAATMPKKRADREAWMTAQGEGHGLGLTRVRQIVRAATALAKAVESVSADRLPIAILNRKLEAVPTALRAVLEGRNPDDRASRAAKPTPANPQERRLAFRARVDAALRAIYSGHTEEIPAALKAVAKQSAKPSSAPNAAPSAPPAVAADDEPRLGPVMQYAGGKSFVAPLLAGVLGRLPDGVELREPYCGGASVSVHMLMNGKASKVWLNDSDPVVQAMWNSVIGEPEALCAALGRIIHGEAEFTRLQKLINKLQLSGPDLGAAAIYVQKTAVNSVYKGAFRPDSKWDLDAAKTRVLQTHDLLKGKVADGRCTGQDALEVIRAPGDAVLFLDPPYWGARRGMYRHRYRVKADFDALAAALRETPHPWIMTIGDDEVSNDMHMPGAAIYKIRSSVRWRKNVLSRMSAAFDGTPGWLIDPRLIDDPPKNELLIVSDGLSERWGLPKMEPARWEELFGDDSEVREVATLEDGSSQVEPQSNRNPNKPPSSVESDKRTGRA